MAKLKTNIYLFIIFAILLRWLIPARDLYTKGLAVCLDGLTTIGLWLGVMLISLAIGRRLLQITGLNQGSSIKLNLFGITLGLGVIAYGVMIIGMLGALLAEIMIAWIGLLAVWARDDLYACFLDLWEWIHKLFSKWRESRLEMKILAMGIGLLFGLTLIQTMAPPWDYDGLLYHLEVPKQYLELGTIKPLPNNWLAYYPSIVEMLYVLGLALGSDVFARLIHLTFATLLGMATYSAGKRYASSSLGGLAALILLTIPIYSIWASTSYTDMGWAVFEFLGLLALMEWWESNEQRWLALAGLMTGFGMASKYLGIVGVAVLFLFALWHMRKKTWHHIRRSLFVYFGMVILGCFPWYFKNLIWTGNPVFPLLYRPASEMSAQWQIWMDYMASFGLKESWLDYLVSPIYIYTRYERYGTFMGSIEIPSLLFLLIVLIPMFKCERWVKIMLSYSGLSFVGWLIGVQQTRYLLPVFPALSLLSGFVIMELAERFKNQRWIIAVGKGVIGGVLAVGLVYAMIFFFSVKPLGVIVGAETKDQFLSRVVEDYRAVRYIQEKLPEDSKVLMLWDGRGYYCEKYCIPDVLHAQWTLLVERAESTEDLLELLKERKITHLLFSEKDADFILQRDEMGIHRNAVEVLVNQLIPIHVNFVFDYQNVYLYELQYNNY